MVRNAPLVITKLMMKPTKLPPSMKRELELRKALQEATKILAECQRKFQPLFHGLARDSHQIHDAKEVADKIAVVLERRKARYVKTKEQHKRHTAVVHSLEMRRQI